MITKPLFLNQILTLLRSLSPKLTSLLLISGFFLISLANPTIAQETSLIVENLPPPPPLSPGSHINQNHNLPATKLIAPSYSSNYNKREYIFSAPTSSSTSIDSAQGYRVEVFGGSDSLLSQVRDIEPKAFRKGDIIQVGIFSEQENAEEMVRKLALQGFWARIVSN
jgi:hypothetical protein